MRRRALLSVTDKSGLVPFATALASADFELLSTGGTATVLREAGLEVLGVAQATGFPELLDGRLKTLHPVVHGGLLGRRDDPGHLAAMEAQQIAPIDVLVVNLYAFRETVARPDVDECAAIEKIDIGGPAMLRSAAKNHAAVWVVSDPGDYDRVLAGLAAEADDPGAALALRRELAAAAFARTASYDAAIATWFETRLGQPMPRTLIVEGGPGEPLRYGENPSQPASFHRLPGAGTATIAGARQLSGKTLSYNNIIDADAALELVREFDRPAVAVIKHTNPCGCGVADDLADAFRRAWAGDPQSAFGGIVALNRPLDAELAGAIARPENFLEVIVAPDFDEQALERLQQGARWGRRVRLLACGELGPADAAGLSLRQVGGGWLVQRRDLGFEQEAREVVSVRQPSACERADLEFAWRVVKHVKSNAIVLARDGALVGAGAGQMSRVDAVFLAGRKAGERARGAVLASDAFFPFRDSIDEAARLGVSALIQPGGSIRDEESVAAANEHGLALLHTGARHFRH